MDLKILQEIVDKLIGPTLPVGDTVKDKEHYVNMETEMGLIDFLLDDILFIAERDKSSEYSVRKAAYAALKYLDEKSQWIREILEEVREQ